MERLQSEWHKKLFEALRDMLEDIPAPAFIMTHKSGEPPLMNRALKLLVPGESSISLEPAAPVYTPSCAVPFSQNGRKTRELVFDVFSLSAFTDDGYRTSVFAVKQEKNDNPLALPVFVSCLLSFYDTPFMTSAVSMLDALPVGAAILDNQGGYIYVSRSLAVWSGASAAKMQERTVFDYAEVAPDLVGALVRGEFSSVEWSTEKDGGETMFSRLYVRSPDQLAQTAVFAGSSDARESAAEAKKQTKKLEEIVERSAIVTFVLNPDRDWTFSYVSKNISRFGISADSGTTSRLKEHIEDFNRFQRKARHALANCRSFADTFKLVNDNGTVFSVHAEMRIVNNSDKPHIEGSFTDISAFEQIKQQRLDAEKRIGEYSLPDSKTVPAITDILSLDFLKRHQDRFAEVFMLPSQIYDNHGKDLTKCHGNVLICSALCGVKSNHTCKLWISAHSQLNAEPNKPAVVSCPDSLAEAAFVPVYIGKNLAAVWKIGGVLQNKVTVAEIESASKRFGKSAALTGKIFQDFPRSEPGTFNLAVEILSILARNISAFASSCIKLTDDTGITNELHREVESLQKLDRRIEKCLAPIAGGSGDVQTMMESVSATFGFDRLYVYENRVLAHEWLGTGIRPVSVRELTPEQWQSVTENSLMLESKSLPSSPQVVQTIWRPLWHKGELFALAGADCCFEQHAFSSLELMDLMMSAIGRFLVLNELQAAADTARSEFKLGDVTVVDYNTRALIYSYNGEPPPHGLPFASLIDSDGRILPPVAWQADGKNYKAAAIYWHDGRLAVLVK